MPKIGSLGVRKRRKSIPPPGVPYAQK